MRKTTALLAALTVMTIAATAPRSAQAYRPSQFYFGGSLPFAIPVGDFLDGANPALGLIGHAEFRVLPILGLTFDLGYVGFIEKNNVALNTMPMLFGARFYHHIAPVTVWGGTRIGMWHTAAKISAGPFSTTVSDTGGGWLFGGGVQYPILDRLLFDAGLEFGSIDLANFDKSMVLMFNFGVRYGVTFF